MEEQVPAAPVTPQATAEESTATSSATAGEAMAAWDPQTKQEVNYLDSTLTEFGRVRAEIEASITDPMERQHYLDRLNQTVQLYLAAQTSRIAGEAPPGRREDLLHSLNAHFSDRLRENGFDPEATPPKENPEQLKALLAELTAMEARYPGVLDTNVVRELETSISKQQYSAGSISPGVVASAHTELSKGKSEEAKEAQSNIMGAIVGGAGFLGLSRAAQSVALAAGSGLNNSLWAQNQDGERSITYQTNATYPSLPDYDSMRAELGNYNAQTNIGTDRGIASPALAM